MSTKRIIAWVAAAIQLVLLVAVLAFRFTYKSVVPKLDHEQLAVERLQAVYAAEYPEQMPMDDESLAELLPGCTPESRSYWTMQGMAMAMSKAETGDPHARTKVEITPTKMPASKDINGVYVSIQIHYEVESGGSVVEYFDDTITVKMVQVGDEWKLGMPQGLGATG